MMWHHLVIVVVMTVCLYDTTQGCIYNCNGLADGDYQWCGICNKFAKCVGGRLYPTDCPGSLVWDDNLKRCEWNSNTCPDGSVFRPCDADFCINGQCQASGMHYSCICDDYYSGEFCDCFNETGIPAPWDLPDFPVFPPPDGPCFCGCSRTEDQLNHCGCTIIQVFTYPRPGHKTCWLGSKRIIVGPAGNIIITCFDCFGTCPNASGAIARQNGVPVAALKNHCQCCDLVQPANPWGDPTECDCFYC